MGKIERNVYLSNLEVEAAQNKFFGSIEALKDDATEKIQTLDSLGRITAKPVFAKISAPHFNASAMDGIAVKAESTYGADERNPVVLKLGQDFIYVDTGDPIKEPFNAVIMIEDVVEVDQQTVSIINPIAPWENVRPVGEDIVSGEMIIPAYHRITPIDISALLNGQVLELEVIKKPRVAIIPTGTEIIEPDDLISEGKIIESNSRMFENFVKEYGGVATRYKPVPDNYQQLIAAVKEASQNHDIIIVNAGSSAGTEDYTAKVISDLGEVIAHGIAIKPGKPAILGLVYSKPVIGIPGYPVSAYFVFDTFVKPLIYRYLKQTTPKRQVIDAVLSKRIISSLKHREFVRVKLGKVNEQYIATPLNRGAGATMSLVKADGVLTIPQNSEGIEAGTKVKVELLKELEQVANTIVSIGSHDLIMDLLANLLHTKYPNLYLSSAHVGSLAGLMSLKRGEAHLAPIHLLDEASGTYNTEYAKRYLPEVETVLIKGVKRLQGFLVKKGNPKKITSFQDLTRDDLQFVNRQKGSGTRILLDYQLKENNLNPLSINGYKREMTTHMAVASAVLSGSADVGVGIKAAADVAGLDFIPVGVEEYDFLMPAKFLNEDLINRFIELLGSQDFRTTLMKYDGYELTEPGKIVRIE